MILTRACARFSMGSLFSVMRYYIKQPIYSVTTYGETYICDHPVYSQCTLFRIKENGLAVIQQRYDEETKRTWWGEIDEWLRGALYLHPGFIEYFNKRAGEKTNGLYPTVTIRQIMWALRMKPLPKKRWETVFDRRDI